MTVLKKQEDNMCCLSLCGRLDTVTAPELEKKLKDTESFEKIVLDFKELEYVSSAGLRVILSLQKRMDKSGGKLVILNVNSMIMELFEMTGLIELLTIENK